MTNENITYNLNINTQNSVGSINDLESSLDAMRTKINTMSKSDAGFSKLQKDIVKADSKLKNMKKSIEGMDFEQIAGRVGQVAGGIGSMTAAFTLFGDESSETMQELQENMNKGLGIFMSVKGAIEAIQGVTALYTVAKAALTTATVANTSANIAETAATTASAVASGADAAAKGAEAVATEAATVAQVGLNTAMLANPVVLITTGVVALTGAILYLTGVFDSADKAQQKVFTATEKAITAANTEAIKFKASMAFIEDSLKNSVKGSKNYENAIDDLNVQLKSLEMTTLNYASAEKDVEAAMKAVNDVMIDRLKFRAFEEQLQKQVIIQLEAEQVIQKLIGDSIKEKENDLELVRIKQNKMIDEQKEGTQEYGYVLSEINKILEDIDKIRNDSSVQPLLGMNEKAIKDSKKNIEELLREMKKLDIGIKKSGEGSGSLDPLTGALELAEDAVRKLRIEIDKASEDELPSLGQQLKIAQLEVDRLNKLIDGDETSSVGVTKKLKKQVEELNLQFAIISYPSKEINELNTNLSKTLDLFKFLGDESGRSAEAVKQNAKEVLDQLEIDIAKNLELLNKMKEEALYYDENGIEANQFFIDDMNYLTVVLEEQRQKWEELNGQVNVSTNDWVEMMEIIKNSTMDVYNSIVDIQGSATDRRIEKLNELMEAEVDASNARLGIYKKEKTEEEIIREKYDAKIEKEKRDQFNREKDLRITQALIDGAGAIVKTYLEYGFTPIGIVSAIALAATTAAQISSIKSQTYADGGLLVGPSHAMGGIATPFGEMEGGEAVINKRSTERFAPVLSAINQAEGGRPIGGGGSDYLAEMIGRAVKTNIKAYVVSNEMTDQQYIDVKVKDRTKI